MVKSSNKILSLALALILVVNVFAGVTLSSDAATSWIWEPYSMGYCGSHNVTAVNNTASGYTTFTVTGDDPYTYPGVTAGSVASSSMGTLSAGSLKYGVVRYRTSTAATGSILANAGAAVTSLGAYNGTGEWTDFKFDSNLTGTIDWYRYDMFDGNAGVIDVAFVAYFDTSANRDTYLANRAVPVEYTTEEISVNGPYLESINSTGTYQIQNGTGAATDYAAFGTSWTAAGFAEGSSFVRLGYDNYVYLGDYNFANVDQIIITYHTDGGLNVDNTERPGAKYSVGLAKTASSFGWADQEPNFSQAIAYGALSNGTTNGWPEARTVTLTNIDKTYSGGVWLTSYACNTNMLVVTGITLVRAEAQFDPSMEKVVDVEFSESGIVDNLSGAFGDVTGAATSYAKDSVADIYAANFDNSSSNSAAIKTAPLPKAALNVLAATSTYETYFKMTPSAAAEEAVFSSCEAAGVGLFSPANETSKYEFYIRDSAGYKVLTFSGATNDTWYHMVVVVNNKVATMYVNGVSVATATLESDIVWTNDGGYTPNTFVIGGDISATDGITEYAKDLSVGFARVYTRALSATEVLTAYEALEVKYNVSVGTVTNGTVTINPTGSVNDGTEVTVTATPATGYELDEILVNGSAITGNTFTVTEDAVVTATFKKIKYNVSVGTVTNGTVTTSATGSIDYGTTITVTATPVDGYQLEAILVNGSAITGNTFTVTEAAVVTATFKEIPVTATTYEVSTGTVTNGTVAATPNGTVEEGTTITVTATPAAGYQLDAILVNGTAITGTTFELTEDAVITATFSLIPVAKYDVSVGTVENGTVTVAPNGEVEEGTTVTVTATAADGYTLDQIFVNGTAITGTTFEVTADSVVTATFKSNIVSVGNILIDKMNFNIWAQPYNTIIFDDTYAGPFRGPWQYTLVCRYNSVLGKYVVEEKYVPKADSNTSFSLAPNQIIINAVNSSASYTACADVWAATDVGSVLTLSGVDLVNQTVSAGAYAAVENGVTIPEDPNGNGTEYEGNRISAYYMNFDFIEADDNKIAATDVGGMGGEGYKYTGGNFDVADKLVLTGWNATANGIDHYEYSFDRLNFTKIEDAVISDRPDLAGADVPYPTGHSTAGCVITIPASAFGTDGTYNLTVRAVDKQGNYYDIFTSVINADVPEGTGDDNQGGQTPGGNGGQEDNVGTDDTMAFTVVGLMVMVAMAAVVLKRRKENI
ncbi:MAG: LamG domain-containing protein [Ruminococcaceae bacterium]|nr:LamG domain-containing protein [Oscillospiraceae bacterium]